MNPARILRIIVAPGIVAAGVLLPTSLRADQAPEETTAILTTGWWQTTVSNGNVGFHVFLPDGTLLAGRLNPDGTLPKGHGAKKYGGTWKIDGDKLMVTYPNQGVWDEYLLPLDPTGTNGVDAGHHRLRLTRESNVVPVISPDQGRRHGGDEAVTDATSLAIDSDTQQGAAAILQAHHAGVFFVAGGTGGGFLANIGKADYAVTTVHAMEGDASLKTLDGGAILGGAPSIAVGADIFCMAAPTGGAPFDVMQGVDANAAIGDAVMIPGNAGGVVNTVMGRITGIGPNLVEVDAPFLAADSGSPIIHLKTGKVIGVAFYQETNKYDLGVNPPSLGAVVRRFAYRLDSVKGWQAVTWPAFQVQAAQMRQIRKLTDDLYDLYQDAQQNKGAVTPGRHANPILKMRIDDWAADKASHPSADDAATEDANLIAFLKTTCEQDIAAAQRQITYDAYLRELTQQKQKRDAIIAALQQTLQTYPR